MTCRQCQSKLVAYVHNQLNGRARARVDRHLNECPVCYAAYLAQRDVAQELAHSLPVLGRPDAPQLGRMWLAIQADMNRPRRIARPNLARFGVACLVLVLALILPWSLDKQQVALAVPPQPSAPPLTVSLNVTASPEGGTRLVPPTAAASSTEAVIPAAETPITPSGTPDTR
jgi:anti-sigma factor RsiW